jgi:hypothetical protein
MTNTKHKPDNPEQSRRFEEKARELGVDKRASIFERAFNAVAKQKSSQKAAKKSP